MDQASVGALLCTLLLAGCNGSPETRLRRTLASQTTGVIHLPQGEVEISSELTLAPGAHDLEIAGSDTRLKAADNFKGRALLVIENAERIRLHDFAIDGHRDKLAKPLEMAPPENVFRIWYPNNGVLANHVTGLEIARLSLTNVVNFPILVSQSSKVRVEGVTIAESGSRNARGRNNLSGGILLEEGVSDFEVRDSAFRAILGNALWTHSLFRAPRQQDGIFARNKFDTIGRDAIQVGHATRVRVEDNTGVNIGYPADIIDAENTGMPVAIDTAGDVDSSVYARNTFEEVNGQCIDLDGFHDGAVRENRCLNRKQAKDYPWGHFGIVIGNTHPNTHANNIEISRNVIEGTKFGGLFLMGGSNRVTGNVFRNLNLAGCNEAGKEFNCLYDPGQPAMLESGIYIGRQAARPEKVEGNTIRGNQIFGHKMRTRCIAFAPGVAPAKNTVDGNVCIDAGP